MKPITTKVVNNLDGTILGVELWQGDQHITTSLEVSSTNHKNGYRWKELKEAIDRLSEDEHKKVLE